MLSEKLLRFQVLKNFKKFTCNEAAPSQRSRKPAENLFIGNVADPTRSIGQEFQVFLIYNSHFRGAGLSQHAPVVGFHTNLVFVSFSLKGCVSANVPSKVRNCAIYHQTICT